MKAVEVLGLGKTYGKTVALEGVSFDADPGDAVALLGPNGAGKTTLLRILATLLPSTSGFARVMDCDTRFHATRIRRIVGFMPDAAAGDDILTVEEYLEFFAALRGQSGAARAGTVAGLIKLLDLEGVRGTACGSLSRGMQQRVGLARTLVHDPSVLLLDEPAANLDPRARIEIREVLKELRRMGKTILISSHILSELAELCNKIVLFDRGKLLYAGSIAEVSAKLRGGRRIAVRVAGDASGLLSVLRAEPDVEQAEAADGWLKLRMKEGREDYSFVVRRVVESGQTLLGLSEEEPSLEEIFMRLTARKEGP